MLWTEKYRPKTLKDIVASEEIISKVLEWAKNWEKGPWKPLLLAGPPGIGKTSLAIALANTMKWEIVELNASDQRNWQIISKIVGEGAFNETISDEGEFLSSRSGRLKLIVLDEVDNIHKKEDVGGESALIRIIKRKPRQPLIL
ncbi:MAG: AAA family ATPase, partial [Archaeoglobaceae archaeon]